MEQVKVCAPNKPFQPSQIFVSKAKDPLLGVG